MIEATFKLHGFKTAFNKPYSNSVTPQTSASYHSVMFEVNKQCYMDEQRGNLTANHHKLVEAIRHIYKNLLP